MHNSRHTDHMHMHVCTHVPGNTLSDFAFFPKVPAPYHLPVRSHPRELSVALTREWVTNAAAELF